MLIDGVDIAKIGLHILRYFCYYLCAVYGLLFCFICHITRLTVYFSLFYLIYVYMHKNTQFTSVLY